MTKLIGSILVVVLAGCGATSYGVSRDGVFPARPSGADYPNWEHLCKAVSKSDVSDTLNEAGAQGFELVALGSQGGADLMCFKRPKAPGTP